MNNSHAQAQQVDYALHTLGWKAFQDLCVAVATEVLGRPVQTFLPSHDGGRDGAFVGTWEGAPDVPKAKSTIQCKFTSKAGKNLSLADLKGEVSKVGRLAARGLAYDYIIMTNAGVSAEAEAEIATAFESAGATRCRVLGGDFLTKEIRHRPRLRMMAPRLYGIGDLSQIIDERSYAQARSILSALGDDLACFVTTEAHRRSVSAINSHRFVLLLGDPASGKSTIGASLAIGALDDGAVGVVRVTFPEDFRSHWDSHEQFQFFWIDDAFGATQLEPGHVEKWNAQLQHLRSAVKSGARIVMTSRTYIWKAARSRLKVGDFPLFENSQVIIDVQSLSEVERAQILYNHVKLGDQPVEVRRKLKPLLPSVAMSKRFLPETARRLGSRILAKNLETTADGVKEFVEQPVEFLKDVIRGLDSACQAAIALIFLHSSTGVPSPVSGAKALDTILRLIDTSAPAASRALEALRGSLTLLVEDEEGPRWKFKHPTIADAYAVLVGESPELVELYVRGAKRDRLLGEVVCGDVQVAGAHVRIPPTLYPMLIERLVEGGTLDRAVKYFLSYRADKRFLANFVKAVPSVFTLVERFSSELAWDPDLIVLSRLQENGLLPDEIRIRAARRVSEITIESADGSIFNDDDVREILTDEEFDALTKRFETDVIDKYAHNPIDWGRNVISTDMPGYFKQLKDGLDRYMMYRQADESVTLRLSRAIAVLSEHIAELEENDDEDGGGIDVSHLTSAPVDKDDPNIVRIFKDIDK